MLINNLQTIQVTNDVIIDLTNIYRYIGKQEINSETVKSQSKLMKKLAAEQDTYYLCKLINLEITDKRLEYLSKNHRVKAKNRKEELVQNVYNLMLTLIEKSNENYLWNTSIQEMVKQVFEPLYKSKLNETFKITKIKGKESKISNITNADKILEFVRKNNSLDSSEKNYEPLLLAIISYIDYYNTKIFKMNHEIYSLLYLYIELIQINVDVYKYESMFKYIYEHHDDYVRALNNVSLFAQDRLPNPLEMERFVLNMLKDGYSNYEQAVYNHKQARNMPKYGQVANTIFNLNDTIFQKKDIQRALPLVSEPTINKTLAALKDQKVITPLGKGRSAKWMRIKNIDEFDMTILNKKLSDAK